MYHPAGQIEVLPQWHPCMGSLCAGLWEKCWWIASTNISCMSGKEIIADGKKKNVWKVPFKHSQWPWSWGHAGGTLLAGVVSPILWHPHKGQPELPLIPSPCQHSTAPVQLYVVLHTSSPVLRAFLSGYLATRKTTSPISERYVFYRRQLDWKKKRVNLFPWMLWTSMENWCLQRWHGRVRHSRIMRADVSSKWHVFHNLLPLFVYPSNTIYTATAHLFSPG